MKIIVCLDGCAPEYLAGSDTPNLDAIAESGFARVGRATVPTVTNVNNATIVTASYPEVHGITSNYFVHPQTGMEVYMESSEFLLTETIFRRAAAKGRKSAVLTAKDKLRTLICDGTSVSESAEQPSSWLVDALGPPPGIYSIEINHWLFRAARLVVERFSPDLLYVTTTDYATHTHPPEAERSRWNVNQLDLLLGHILNASSEAEIVVTADHGMNWKTRGLDLNRIFTNAGIEGDAIPIIKDRYVAHHQNMGGAAYVYLKDPESTREDAMALLREERGVEAVMASTKAASEYHLHPERIGHLFVLADVETVFGSIPSAREEVTLRSHGSLHECDIPIIGCGRGPMSAMPQSNREVAAWIA